MAVLARARFCAKSGIGKPYGIPLECGVDGKNNPVICFTYERSEQQPGELRPEAPVCFCRAPNAACEHHGRGAEMTETITASSPSGATSPRSARRARSEPKPARQRRSGTQLTIRVRLAQVALLLVLLGAWQLVASQGLDRASSGQKRQARPGTTSPRRCSQVRFRRTCVPR